MVNILQSLMYGVVKVDKTEATIAAKMIKDFIVLWGLAIWNNNDTLYYTNNIFYAMNSYTPNNIPRLVSDDLV